jgi:NAD-dependent SIR2 family protein deacetylase
MRGKGLPDGTELAQELARRVRYEGPMDLRKVAQYAVITGMESAFEEMLRGIVGVECAPNELHRLLAEMSETSGLSVTTNYDTLLERAMGDRPYDVVIHSPRTEWGVKYFGWLPHDRGWLLNEDHNPEWLTDDQLAKKDLRQRPVIFKMHGTFPSRRTRSGRIS